MSKDNGSSNLQGSHKHSYVPTLKSGNPEKKRNHDWWDEVCKANGEKNYFPKKGSYRGDSPLDD